MESQESVVIARSWGDSQRVKVSAASLRHPHITRNTGGRLKRLAPDPSGVHGLR